MKRIILLAAVVVSQLAGADVGPALIDSIPQSAFPALEERIQTSVEQLSGINLIGMNLRGITLKDFKVRWNDVKDCLEVKNEMNDSKLMGVCTVPFGAFQVQGEALVIVKEDSYSTSVLYVNVE